MRFQYTGPGPVPDPEGGEIVRPGDILEFDEIPPWGPWECLDDGTRVTTVDLDKLRAATAPAPFLPVPPATTEGM